MRLTPDTWATALESGEFKQSTGRLRSIDGFCCLGVLCELSGAGEWTIDDLYRIEGWGNSDYLLPSPVLQMAKLATVNGAFSFASLSKELQDEILSHWTQASPPDCLAALNDKRVPFAVIAKVIRARPLGLFLEDEHI